MDTMTHQIDGCAKISKTKAIKFGSLHACSYIRKQDEILILLKRTTLDYLSLTETWPNSSITDTGYSIIRSDRGVMA